MTPNDSGAQGGAELAGGTEVEETSIAEEDAGANMFGSRCTESLECEAIFGIILRQGLEGGKGADVGGKGGVKGTHSGKETVGNQQIVSGR